ncbi:MAG: tyrosine-type recombinase/integrase [Clostridiales bacterium]|jgi:integrase|nr:tyrosine-type recombinase/integrase [Clostridiales bacterium]
MMKYVPVSALAPEILEYLDVLKAEGKYMGKPQTVLCSLDSYLAKTCNTSRILTESDVIAWLGTLEVSGITKRRYLSDYNGFARHLRSLSLRAESPDYPKANSTYTPYLFSEDELERIFAAADSLMGGDINSRSKVLFPFLLRVYFGCGLRLMEGLSLKWRDVDLECGVLTIREAKGGKERIVPISKTLVDTLWVLRELEEQLGLDSEWLFESTRGNCVHYGDDAFQEWFAAVLLEAGIVYAKSDPNERGPCVHCMRHVFVRESYFKAEREGRRFEDMERFLSAYLGHESFANGTERYMRSSHVVYKASHKRVNEAIGGLFPKEWCKDEEE